MNYASLVKAIQEGDRRAANRLVAKARPILIRMLRVRMNASREDAEDAVQKMFVYVIEAIQDDKIENPSGILSYMIMSCRHNYLKELETLKPELLEDQVAEPIRQPDQLSNLIGKEVQKIHIDCINRLKDDYKEFYIYTLNYPDADASDIAQHFSISVNNVWTRKHRVLKKVHDCVKSKIQK